MEYLWSETVELWKRITVTFQAERCILWANAPLLHKSVYADCSFSRKKINECIYVAPKRQGGQGRKKEEVNVAEYMSG